jgi:hypothetical protein
LVVVVVVVPPPAFIGVVAGVVVGEGQAPLASRSTPPGHSGRLAKQAEFFPT